MEKATITKLSTAVATILLILIATESSTFAQNGKIEEYHVILSGASEVPAVFTTASVSETLERGDVNSSETDPEVVDEFELKQNFPNPFNPTTNITYSLPQQGEVELRVFDMVGREVATLVNREQAAGSYTVNFDASQLSSGMYLYRLNTASTTITRKMMLIK